MKTIILLSLIMIGCTSPQKKVYIAEPEVQTIDNDFFNAFLNKSLADKLERERKKEEQAKRDLAKERAELDSETMEAEGAYYEYTYDRADRLVKE